MRKNVRFSYHDNYTSLHDNCQPFLPFIFAILFRGAFLEPLHYIYSQNAPLCAIPGTFIILLYKSQTLSLGIQKEQTLCDLLFSI